MSAAILPIAQCARIAHTGSYLEISFLKTQLKIHIQTLLRGIFVLKLLTCGHTTNLKQIGLWVWPGLMGEGVWT